MTLHGNATHGMSRTRVYRIWRGMLNRCHLSSSSGYYKYGAKGIRVCGRWHRFENFYADLGDPPPGTSIERNNNKGNYEPGNCRWATKVEQANNTSANVRLAFNNRLLTLAEWSRVVAIDAETISKRLKLGWSIADALTKPMRARNRVTGVSFEASGKRTKRWLVQYRGKYVGRFARWDDAVRARRAAEQR